MLSIIGALSAVGLSPGVSPLVLPGAGARVTCHIACSAVTPLNSPKVRHTGQAGVTVEKWYLDSFNAVSLLSAEEECRLARDVQSGDALDQKRAALEEVLGRPPTDEEWARGAGLDTIALRRALARSTRASDHMVAANMRLVVSVCRPYATRNIVGGHSALSIEDLVQEGSVGLLKAVRRFDPERGLRFSTFATWWIRASVQRAVAATSRPIRLPDSKFRLLSKAKHASTKFESEYGRTPEAAELAAEVHVSPKQLDSVLRHWNGVSSLDAPRKVASQKADHTKGGTLLDSSGVKPLGAPVLPLVEDVEVSLMRETLDAQMQESLTPLEASVLRLRYGLDDGECLSWKEIAESCDQSVKQLHVTQSRAFRRLRKGRKLAQLQDFCHHPEWEHY